MKTIATLAAALALSVASLAIPPASAQDKPPREDQREEGRRGMMQGMGMMQMMHECMEHCRAVQEPAEDLRRKVAEARRSNDPALMKRVLEEVETYLEQTESRMSRCMEMMGDRDMMERPKRGKKDGK